MSKICLITFIFMVTFTVNGAHLSEQEFDSESLEEAVTDALIGELKSEIKSEISQNKRNGDRKSETELQTSPSRIEDLWLEPGSEPTSLFDDPDENDALHSRDYTNSNKREEYYENLEKKSLRTTYAPPPRKNFYTTPDFPDSSVSEEYIPQERRSRRPSSEEDQREDYYPQPVPVRDAARAESHHLIDSLDVVPARIIHQSRAMQTPPWRLTRGKTFVKAPNPPVVMSERQKFHESVPAPMIQKAPSVKQRSAYQMAPPVKQRSAYQMAPPVPKRPVHINPIHVNPPKIHYNEEAKFKTITKSKPWVTEYVQQPTTPKFPAREEKALERSSFGSGFRKATRQQFHEQGTRGPHSYKFGYNTGDRDNPMARYEERDADGIVRGSYSYIDARGVKQVVHYESHPKFGFKTKLSSGF